MQTELGCLRAVHVALWVNAKIKASRMTGFYFMDERSNFYLRALLAGRGG